MHLFPVFVKGHLVDAVGLALGDGEAMDSSQAEREKENA
jgi:hypothetical protein